MHWHRRYRRYYGPLVRRSPNLGLALLAATRRSGRDTSSVREIYEHQWAHYAAALERAATLDEWLHIPGVDDVPETVRIGGRVVYGAIDHLAFYVDLICRTIRSDFSHAQSVTEYGCGIGRNLLALKRLLPEVAVYGYELTEAGVRIARTAAEKFGVDVQYARADYVDGPESAFVHPATDVAMTVYSLQEAPDGVGRAVGRIAERTNQGLLLLEPTPERNPRSLDGLRGRVYTRLRGYTRGLDAAVRSSFVGTVDARRVDTVNSPFLFPTLYVLKR